MSAYFLDSDLPKGLKGVFERSGVSLTLADYTAEDCPLIAVNQAFCDMSGYAPDEVLGRNCRFLQPGSDAGPVRERMRAFLKAPREEDGRFIIPNVTRDGRQFINLVYMAKLARQGEVRLVLGSQFAVDQNNARAADVYERALREDLRQLNLLTSGNIWAVLGSFEVLASSHAILARLAFD